MIKNSIYINFDIADSIKTQLKRQGLNVEKALTDSFQILSESILQLWFAEIITDLQKEKLQNKLFKKIMRCLKQVFKNEIKKIEVRKTSGFPNMKRTLKK